MHIPRRTAAAGSSELAGAAKRARVGDPAEAKPQRPPQLPDLALLDEAQRIHGAVLGARGIESCNAFFAGMLRIPGGLDVEMDAMEVRVLREGEAIRTTGVGPCFALCARAALPDGRAIVGLCHSSGAEGREDEVDRDVVASLVRGVAQAAARLQRDEGIDAGQVQLQILGGLVCMELDDENPERSPMGSIERGMRLLEAARDLQVPVTSARIGLSEEPQRGERPPSIDVYLPCSGDVLWVPGEWHGQTDPALFAAIAAQRSAPQIAAAANPGAQLPVQDAGRAAPAGPQALPEGEPPGGGAAAGDR